MDYVGKVILSDHALRRMALYKIPQRKVNDTLRFGLKVSKPVRGEDVIKLIGPEITLTLNTEKCIVITMYINDREANFSLAEKAAKRKSEAFAAEAMKKLCSKGDWKCKRLKPSKESYKQRLKRSTSTLW